MLDLKYRAQEVVATVGGEASYMVDLPDALTPLYAWSQLCPQARVSNTFWKDCTRDFVSSGDSSSLTVSGPLLTVVGWRPITSPVRQFLTYPSETMTRRDPLLCVLPVAGSALVCVSVRFVLSVC